MDINTLEETNLESTPDVNEPIYKSKDGQIVTYSQLIHSGYNQKNIDDGISTKILSLVGDTKDHDQEYQSSDGQKVTTKQLLESGYLQTSIDQGVFDGVLTPLEKKNQIQDVSTTSSDNLQAGASDSTTNIPTVPLTKDGAVAEVTPVSTEPTDLISQVLKMQDLKNKVGDVSVYGSTGGAAVLVAPDEKSVKEAAKIKEELKKQDINADAVYNQIKDIPKELYDWHFKRPDGTIDYPYSKENLSIKIVEEPLGFSNLINNAKNRIDLQKAVNNIPETERIEKGITPISVMNEYNDLNKADNLEQYKNSNLERQKELINTYIDDLSDRKKALNRLETGAASFITPNNTDLIKEYQASPLKNQLDISQYAALEVKRIFHPDQYKQAIDFLNAPTITEISPQQKITFGKDGFSVASISQDESEESLNRKLGKETVLKNLADEGRYNAILDLQTKNERLAAASKKATTQEEADRIKQQYDANTEKINAIKADYQKDGEKYPLSSDLKYEQQVKDIQQQAGFNGAEYGVAKLATGLIKTGKSIENILINIFGNNQDKVLHDLASLGEYQQEQSDFYLPKKYNKDNPIVGIKVSKNLQEDLNKILKGKNVGDLSEEENNQLKEVLAQNQNQIETITDTDTEGKGANYTASSILYSNAGMLGDIASFALQGGFLKALGVGSALAASIPMFTTSQDDFRKEAIAKGNPDPDGYANVMATIIGLAGMISPQLDIVKRAIGIESKAGQMLVGVSEKTWNNVIEKNKPLVDRIYNSFAHTAKEAANMGLTYGAGVPIAQGVVGKEMYNEPVSYSDIYQNAINSTEHLLVSSIALLGVGAITNFKTTTLEQKSSLWNASSNRLMSLTRIDEAVKNKEITPEQGAERKKVINTSADIIQNMPTRKANGEKMTDKERLNYFYNLVIEDNVKKQKSVLPKAQQEKLDYTTMVADHLNDLIIDPKTLEELNTRKKELEAFLTPQKDKEGKEIVLSEKDQLQAQSELEAINTHLEDKIKEQQPVPTTEEIITGKPAKPVEIKEQTVEPVSDITVSEMLDKTGKYKGEEGSFYQDGQTVVFKVAGKNKEYELGNIEEIGDSPIKDFDIEHKESVVTIGENGELIVRGEEYKNRYSDPLMAIDRDANGNVIGVTLETKNGNKRRFRGNTAEDIAYQIHLQEINKNNETAEFEEFINEPEQQQQIGDATVSIATPEVTVESTEPIQREKIEPVQTEVEKLRAEEQAELDSKIENAEQYRVDGKVDRTKIEEKKQEERKKWKYDYSKPNPIDAKYDAELKAFDEVYDKYDKLITPLLKETEAPTPSVEAPKAEFKEPKDDTERKSVADRLRSAKIKSDKLFDATIGLPIAVWNGAVELVAKSIEGGMLVADAIKRGVNYIEKNHRGKWDKKAYNDKVIEALGHKGININGEDVIAKPMLDKQSADVINGFYSPLEQGILDTKLEKTTGKEWAKKLEGTTEGDELRFTGMSDFLAENADKTLTKQEVLDYMKNNRIEIVEISKSDEVVSGLSIKEIQDKFEEQGLTIDQQYGEVFIENENQELIGFEELPLELQPLAVSYGRQLGQAEFKESQTKYSEYQLPGESSNYKEVLITLPKQYSDKYDINKIKIEEEPNFWSFYDKDGELITSYSKRHNITKEDAINTFKNNFRLEKNTFKSSHFDEPNILAHVRMNTRVDAEGNKVLHIEEFQSDWGQEGKRHGFEKIAKLVDVNNTIVKLSSSGKYYQLYQGERFLSDISKEEGDRMTKKDLHEDLVREANRLIPIAEKQKTPIAPFVTETANWTKLAWEVALKEAVKEKADKITWTTGEQQNERYDLSKQVNNIHVEGVENVKGVHLVDIELANGGKEYLEVENGIIREGKYEGKRLDDVIGKEYAEKVLSVPEGKTKVLKGEDLKLGGTGMKGFYGSPSEGKLGIVGEVAKSLFKQEPNTTTLQGEKPITIENTLVEKGEESYILKNENGDSLANMSFDSIGSQPDSYIHKSLVTLAKKFAKKEVQETTQHSIDITPEIIQGVKEGMSMFKSPFQKTADFFRKGKIGNDIAMGTIPFLKEVWNGALEVAAKTAELTGDSVKAIKEAVKYIKSTDWYKSLSTSDKDSMVNHFIDEHIDLLPKGKESLDLSVETEHPYLYRGSTEKRVSGLMRHMMESENVSDATKEDLKRNGIDYAIANNEEARKTASEIVDAFGEEDALRIAEQTDMHPSVRSAIFAETIDRAYSREKNATTDAEKIEAAEQWKDRVNAYDKLLTAGGQFTAYVNHFYGTSPLGFVMRENENTQGRFNDWFKDKEPTYQELLDALNETAEGKTFIADEVERIVKEERKQRREKRDKNIEDFFDKAKLQGGTYLTVIPPRVWNGAMDAMKAAVKAGDRVSDAVQRAIETISAQIGNNWDKEKFRKEYEGLLAKVADGDKKEAEKQDLASVYERRKKELERRLTNKDFSAEEYKDKKTLSDKEQAAKEEYDRIKKLYDEEKKKSPEWQDKKAKQFLDKFRDRMKGLDDKQKEEVVRKSIKKLAETGALREEEFRKIVAETIGFKDLNDTQVKQIEDLTKTINSLSDVEDAMVANPNEKTIADYKKAKEDAIQAGLDLYNIVHKKSDIISTIKSLITGSLLSVPTLIKNIDQNINMQGIIRFPKSVVRQIGELGVYGITYLGNKTLGTKLFEPTTNIFKSQKAYFKGYGEGLKRGWFNFKRGTQEQDYFGKTSYQSTLAPRQALKDLKLWRSGEKFLTKTEVADRWIRASIFARQADFILRGMGFGDRPQRFAAERSKAINIATYELKLIDDASVVAFMESPQKMAYKTLIESGIDKGEALRRSIEIEERIKQEGSKAVLEEENLLSMASSYIEKGLASKKENSFGMKGVKAVGSVAKTLTFPFIKIPGNVYWQMFKLFNPEVSIGQALFHSGEAYNYSKKGDNASARQSIEKAKDSMSMAFLGLGLATAATTLVSQGYIRSNPSQDDAAKVRAGQRLFGKQNQINLGRLMGGEDYWVDLAWFGPVGSELDIKNRLYEDKIKNNLKGKEEPSPFGKWWNGLEYSAAAALNQLVFDQGARTVNALKDGQNGAKIWFVNTMNTFENIFTGATYAAISKAMLPEEPRLRGDEVTDELLNNLKQRNVLVRLVLGRPPAKISMWGEPIKKDNSISGVMGNILGWEKGSANQFGSILYDDYRKTKDSRFFPPVEDNKLKIDDKDVEITQAEKDDLEVFIGKARKQLVSAFVYDSSLPYKVSVQAPDENGNMVTKGEYKHYSNLTEDQKAEALTQIYKQGKETGYAQFLEKYPQYALAKLTSKELGAQIKKEAYNEKFKFDMEKLLKNK